MRLLIACLILLTACSYSDKDGEIERISLINKGT